MRKLNASLVTIITLLVLGSPSALSQRTSVGRQFPVYDNGGKPDLTVDPQRFTSQMEIVDRLFEDGTCAIEEGAVDGDLIVGDRSDPNNPYAAYFVFAPCHGHYHIRDFSVYELLDTGGTTVVAGHKQGFCFEDSFKYAGARSNGYSCAYQGITSGWGDWYYKQLTGQWIDITGVPEGDYVVRVTINQLPIFDEGENRYPNVVQTPIHVPSPRKKVSIDNSPALVDY